MKKLILLALTALVMVGCVYETDSKIDSKIEGTEYFEWLSIVVIDSCEYIKAHEMFGY